MNPDRLTLQIVDDELEESWLPGRLIGCLCLPVLVAAFLVVTLLWVM